jgi:hypothetical protein
MAAAWSTMQSMKIPFLAVGSGRISAANPAQQQLL